MKSGKLREAIAIQRATTSINDAGTPADTWSIIARLRAEKVEQSTAEAIRAFGASDEELVIFRARFFEGVTTADRVLWNGQTFNIKQIAPLGQRAGLELRCVRGIP
jgi:head-tail adaptor